MGYGQPRVPEYREEDGTGRYMRALALFLKDFSLAAWAANQRRRRETAALQARLQAAEERLAAIGTQEADAQSEAAIIS